MRQNWKKIWAGISAAVMCAAALPGGAVSAEGTDTAMGRYLETEIELPEGFYIQDAVRMEDKALAVIGQGADNGTSAYRSLDGGGTWELMYTLPEEYSDYYFAATALSPKGGGSAILMEPLDENASMEEINLSYVFASFNDQGEVQITPLEEDGQLRYIDYSESGELFGMSYNEGALLLDENTGEIKTVVSSAYANVIGTCGSELLVFNDEEVQRYDLSTGEPVTRDDALNEALYTGNVSYMQTTSSGYTIALAQDEEERLYYCTNNGIYSHIMGGSAVEQIVDGTLSSLSSPGMVFQSLTVIDGTFYLVCINDSGENKMMKYSYDADVPSTPERELTIYSLNENDAIRQAAVQFQKKYPDTYVNYVTGMSGTDAVTAADALRTLNTDILSGNGPDVLVLDGLSVETYAGQGILADLSDVVNKIRESDGILDHIAQVYQTDETLPAVPAKFSIEAAAGDPALLEKLDGISSLAELAATPGALDTFDILSLTEVLYPVCAGSWKNEDQTINQEKLAEFVNGVKNAYDNFVNSASEETKAQLEQYTEGYYASFGNLPNANQDGMVYGLLNLCSGESRLKLGSIGDIMTYVGLTSVNEVNGACQIKPLAMQLSDVFLPSCILSVLSTSGEQERAFEFVEYMLSAEGQEQNSWLGFPVNQEAFDTLLSTNQFEDGDGYSVGSSDGGENYIELTYVWPTQEEIDALRQTVESLTTCANMESVQKETVVEEMRRCLAGEISTDEAVNSIMQKLNLYLAE